MSNIAALIITIGDELLIGQTIDTNSAWIAQRLNQLGIDVIRRVAVGDARQPIIDALNEELRKADIVLITGGLGPTADDITKPLLAEYFGAKLVVNEQVVEHLKTLFIKRNRPFLERNMKQAEVPDNCTVLFNRLGTAPGMWFEKDNKVIISMPGVPFEMMGIMDEEVLPRLSERYISDALVHATTITAGEGESFIAEKIKDIEENLPPHVKLAYLPGAGMVKLRLTGRGKDKNAVQRELQHYQGRLTEVLKDIVFATSDVSLAQIIGERLNERKATLALAESCTGGYIGHQITQVPGSSGYFKGGVVCYTNDVKEQVLGVDAGIINAHGAVSEETAIKMAEGVKKLLQSDYVLAITGILGPRDEREAAPVGTVWVALANEHHTTTRKFFFPYDRERNKEMAASMGMLSLLKFINHESDLSYWDAGSGKNLLGK